MQPDGSGGPPPGLEQCLELLRGPQDERRYYKRGSLGNPAATLGTLCCNPASRSCTHAKWTRWVHRFVGLLLATKLLPAGNQDVLLAISSAVSFRFLSRLLLPLQSSKVIQLSVSHLLTLLVPEVQGRSQAGRVAREDELPKTAAAAGLGLAVLSSLFRVHELACSDDALDKVPLFVKVRQACNSAFLKSCEVSNWSASRIVGTCMVCSKSAGLIMLCL